MELVDAVEVHSALCDSVGWGGSLCQRWLFRGLDQAKKKSAQPLLANYQAVYQAVADGSGLQHNSVVVVQLD